MINYVPIKVVGGEIICSREKTELTLGYKREEYPFAFTVTTVTTHPFGKICVYFIGHRAAVTASMICFHEYDYIREALVGI